MSESGNPPLRELGLWWLPGDRDRSVAGILTYAPAAGAQLELIGSLNDPFARTELSDGRTLRSLSSRAPEYGRICGMAGGKSFTLEGCFQLSISNVISSGPGGSTEKIHVNTVVRGAEFELDEQLDAMGTDVRLLHLAYWVAEGGIAERWYWPDSLPAGEPNARLEVTLMPDREIQLDNGMKLVLRETFGIVGNSVTGRGFERDFRVRLIGDRLELTEYIDVVSTFQALVSMGAGRSATIEEFTFSHPDIVHDFGNGSSFVVPIEFYAQWYSHETRQPGDLRHDELLFNLTELGGDDVVRRWCSFGLEHRGTIARVMATRYRSGGFASDRLLNRAAALEALDRDTNNQDDRSFKDRMLRLVALAGPEFSAAIGDVDRWAKRLKDARVAAAHHSNSNTAEVRRDDHHLSEAAYYLFVVCALRLIGADAMAIDRIVADRRFRFACQQLQHPD